MRTNAIHSEHITHRGCKFRIEHFYDNDHGAPWRESDGESLALWGIESNSGDYLSEVATELADEICNTLTARVAAELEETETRMQRTREHVRAWLREYRAIVRELGARSFPTLCDTARRNLQREILELNAMRNRARELRNLAALGA